MKLNRKEWLLLGVVVLLCAVAAFAIFRRPAADQNFPDGTWWVCTNDGCKNEFNLSIGELADHHKQHYGEPVKCPKCKAEALQARKCTACGKVAVQRLGTAKCPACGKSYEEQAAAAGG